MTPNDVLLTYLTQQNVTGDDWHEIADPNDTLENDPMLMLGSKTWLNTLYQHRGDVITVVGDYDADGILASKTMVSGLTTLGVGSKVNVYVPTRMDGYGMTPTSVAKIQAQFPDTQTIVTVDNGISAFDGIQSARDLGWHVLVTDHHLAKDELPNANAIVDINQRGDQYPFKSISGTAMAYKMLKAYARVVAPDKLAEIDALRLYVGISTVSDMMNLRGENRFWVKSAIAEVQRYVSGVQSDADNPYLRVLTEALIENHALWGEKVNSETFGFTIAPILNAPSRTTGTPQQAFDFFFETDKTKLPNMARGLIETNTLRKEIIGTEVDSAVQRVHDNTAIFGEYGAMVDTIPLSAGFVGLVAGKLSRDFNRPSVTFSTVDFDGRQLGSGDNIHGSARSPEGLSIVDVFSEMATDNPDLFVSFGGHAGASGLAIPFDKLDFFREQFDRVVRQKLAMGATLKQEISGIELDVNDITPDLVNAINQMAPFGMGFPKPKFILRNLPHEAFKMGSAKQHVRFSVGHEVDIIDWYGAEHYDAVVNSPNPRPLDCYGSLDFGKPFRGVTPIQMIVDGWL